MNKEIEMELETRNLKTIEERLKELNATLIEKAKYNDIYFDPDNFYKNNRIRLRKKDVFFPEKKGYAPYTEKAPKAYGNVQIASEKEKIVDFEKSVKLLKIKGNVLKEGAFNRSLELKGLPKIKVN